MIQIRSLYDIKTFKAFQRYTLKRIFILSYFAALALIGVGVYFIFTSRKSHLVYLIFGVVFPIMVHIFYKFMEIDAINKNMYLRDTTMQIFSFDEEGFKLEQISKLDTFRDEYLYKDIFSVIKYKKYYFIYINRVQAFVINNLDYTMGSEKELDELFKKVFEKRFMIKGLGTKKD